MELNTATSVTPEMFHSFVDSFFQAWKNDQEGDEKIANDQKLLNFLPQNIKWELKPLAVKQYEKVKNKIADASEAMLNDVFQSLAESLAEEFYEEDLGGESTLTHFLCLRFARQFSTRM